MDIRKTMGSQKHLKTADLNGKPAVVNIAGVAMEMVGQGRDAEEKAVLSFANREKTLVLNSSNSNTIGEAFGWETDGWKGRQVELYPTTTDFAGKIVDCIRIRVPAAAAPADEPVGATVREGNEVPF